MLVFSSRLSTAQWAGKLISHDAVTETNDAIRGVLQNLNFIPQDKLCDATKLRLPWENTCCSTHILLITFQKSHFLQVSQVNIEKGNALIVMITNMLRDNTLFQLYSLYQIPYYEMFHRQRKTPLHMMTAHSTYDKCTNKEIISSFNSRDMPSSYADLTWSRNLLSSYAIMSRERAPQFPVTSAAVIFTVGALNNFDFEERLLSGNT